MLGIGIDIVSTILLAFFVAVILAIIGSAIKIIPEYRRLVVFRLGKLIGVKGPGVDSSVKQVSRKQVYPSPRPAQYT